MTKTGKTAKLFLIFYVLGIVIWLGGSIIRTAVAYDIYVPATELQLKTNYGDEMRLHSVKLYAMSAVYTDFAYGAAALSCIVLLFLLKGQIKQRGWIFISTVLFILSIPLEAILIYHDINLNSAIRQGILTTFSSDLVSDNFVRMFTKLNFIAPISYLLGATSLIVGIWQPLDKSAGN